MSSIKRHRGTGPMPPLHWQPPADKEAEHFAKIGIVAIVTCKNGHGCSLSNRVHSVSAAGVMQPSLGCPTPGCDGHEMPGSVLEEWGQP